MLNRRQLFLHFCTKIVFFEQKSTFSSPEDCRNLFSAIQLTTLLLSPLSIISASKTRPQRAKLAGAHVGARPLHPTARSPTRRLVTTHDSITARRSWIVPHPRLAPTAHICLRRQPLPQITDHGSRITDHGSRTPATSCPLFQLAKSWNCRRCTSATLHTGPIFRDRSVAFHHNSWPPMNEQASPNRMLRLSNCSQNLSKLRCDYQ